VLAHTQPKRMSNSWHYSSRRKRSLC